MPPYTHITRTAYVCISSPEVELLVGRLPLGMSNPLGYVLDGPGTIYWRLHGPMGRFSMSWPLQLPIMKENMYRNLGARAG